jgi:hypothetical protein
MLIVHELTRLQIWATFSWRDGECIALQGPSGTMARSGRRVISPS